MSSAFQVDLRGMVDLLSRNLYSGPRVYVRELLQNAVDAIAARRDLDATCPARVTITVSRDGTQRVLTCTDTGVGLSGAQVERLLSTIGASSKRDELGLARGDYLGQFGIGLLSCFMVSPEILVTSRSATGAPAVRWRGRTDGTYAVEPAAGSHHAVGTTVTLRSLPGETWLEAGTVRALVEEFGALLPVDIEVRGDDGAVTLHGRGRGLWEMGRHEAVDWCERELGSAPFDLLELSVPEAGLRGTIVVLARANPGAAASHTVSVKRMLVTRAAENLAPDWAYFVRVVADASNLHLTASRESLVDDDLLERVRDAVAHAVRDWLNRLGRLAPARLVAFVESHAVGLSSVAVDNLDVLRLVAHHVPLGTTRGDLTLAELAALAASGEPVRWTRTVDQYRALADVADSQGIVLVNAGHVYEAELIAALATHPEALDTGPAGAGSAGLVLVDPQEILDALTSLGPAEEAQALDLLVLAGQALAEVDVEVVLRRFEPATLPALYLPDPDLAGRRVQDSSAAAASASQVAAAQAWSQVLGVTDPFALAPRPRLVLNRSSALVTRLVHLAAGRTGRDDEPDGSAARPPVDAAALTRVLRGLYVQCLLLSHHALSAKERSWAGQTLTALLEGSLGAAVPTKEVLDEP